jgi:signal peptidase I
MRTTIFSSFISILRKQRVALQSIVATIPFIVYFSDEFCSITRMRGSSMEPTIQDGDIVLIRKRDAGKVLLNTLYSIGYLNSSPSSSKSSSDTSNNRINVDNAGNTERTFTNQPHNYDDDRLQALRYRLENSNDSTNSNSNNTFYWFISPSYMSPLTLPGHVVVYHDPFQFQKSMVERVIGVGGQRISTRPNKAKTNKASIVLPNDLVFENTNQVEGNNESTNNDNALPTSSTSEYPSLLQHLRRKQQQQKETDEFYDLRLPPHYFYTEKDNSATFTNDSSFSRKNQQVSQNVMIGIAEYIIWPPSRFQRIVRQPVYEAICNDKNIHSISRPRAIWDK